jgi:hypothetical protein
MNTLEQLTENLVAGASLVSSTPMAPGDKDPGTLSTEQLTKDFKETMARLKLIISQGSPMDRGKIKGAVFNLFRPDEATANKRFFNQ